jgi:anti-sigma regulatory factor (Ser/Thr protein kinase)
VTTGEMRHDVLVYDSDDDFARNVGPFVEEALDGGEPVVVVTNSHLRAILGDTLGAAADVVTFLDRDRFYTRPEAALAAYDAKLRFLLHHGARSVRVYGELPIRDGDAHWNSWQRYEAILNRAFAGQPVWIRCGYDARALPPAVVKGAWRTHRDVHAQEWQESPHYDDPADIVRALTPAPEPVDSLRSLPLAEDARSFRQRLAREMAEDGVDDISAGEMLVAAGEVLANARRHAGGLISIRVGRVGDGFVCELADSGGGIDDPLAGYVPPRGGPDGAGLWVARQLTKRLDLVPSSSGFTVRLWV